MSTTSKIKREAIRDADEYAMAKMFYGEGAGVRRRLINQTVQFKIANIPGYDAAFQQELARQDFAKLSRKARRERRTKDGVQYVSRNGRALIRGDHRGLSLAAYSLVALGYFAHKEGYDKVALASAKNEYKKAKAWVGKKWRSVAHPHVKPVDPKFRVEQVR